MLKKILLGLVVAVITLCGFIATRPSTFKVERTATFKASPDIAFALVNDFHHWDGWSPWTKLDPAQKLTFSGAALGLGAEYDWAGNDQVGEGRMIIEESKASERVGIKMEFLKPFPSVSTVHFTFAPAAEGSQVTWTMEGDHNFISKAMCLVMDMDQMLGKDFEKGLAAMGKLAEDEAVKRAEAAKQAAQAAAPVDGQPAPSGQVIATPTP